MSSYYIFCGQDTASKYEEKVKEAIKSYDVVFKCDTTSYDVKYTYVTSGNDTTYSYTYISNKADITFDITYDDVTITPFITVGSYITSTIDDVATYLKDMFATSTEQIIVSSYLSVKSSEYPITTTYSLPDSTISDYSWDGGTYTYTTTSSADSSEKKEDIT